MPLQILHNDTAPKRTPFCSWATGPLAPGCEQCVKGEKLVVFVTGMCPATCFYCPISDEKKMNDVSFANERPLKGTQNEMNMQLIAEARAMGAKGAGITGGDPLARLARTCAMIRALKQEFGPSFHIHLYTPLHLVSEKSLSSLYDAGLDEIRFHPDIDDEKFWPRLALAKRFPWRVGLEIPIFPDKLERTLRLLTFARPHVEFMNLNELELSDRTIDEFARRKYRLTTPQSYAIKGSKEAALRVMRENAKQDLKLPIHFCTVRLKDHIQMGNRVKRSAGLAAQAFDIVDDEGMLTRGAIYIGALPGFGYKKALQHMSERERSQTRAKLAKIFSWLIKSGMPADAGMIDDERLRIILSADALRDIAPEIKRTFRSARCAIVTEWPTSDAFLVEIEPLK
jgi:pyruvate formate-lyase activating enzyme-like uncharacterized protein